MSMNMIPRRRREEGAEIGHPIDLFRRQMDRLFDDFWGETGLMSGLAGPGAGGTFLPRVDVTENESEVTVTAELPGLTDKDVEVSLAQGRMVLSGQKKSEQEHKDRSLHIVERSYGSFKRVIELPSAVQEDKAQASFRNGVLTVKVPKGAEVRSRKIQIREG
ncbi:MAG TPA: Hsp20/alpha crystallin family protein [Planctomycetota bacterium]|nr:Hsp20/alpha crystallin family protein [Planctomycetota bacterium]